MYDLVLTRDAQRFYERADQRLARRLNRCFDHLRRSATFVCFLAYKRSTY